MAKEKTRISSALERVSEAAHSLAVHGAGGYSIDTSALDEVFARTLLDLRNAMLEEDCAHYDPRGNLFITIEGIN